MYILTLVASATVTKLFSFMSGTSFTVFSTATITSLSLPTPQGSMRMRSGWNCSCTSFSALLKSPTREQQMHPEDISLICTPESFRNPPSMLISPNSFSISTSFSPGKASASSFLMSVRLACAQESGNDVDLCHSKNLLFSAARCGVNFVPCPAFAVQRTKKGGGNVFHLYNIPFFEKCKSCR